MPPDLRRASSADSAVSGDGQRFLTISPVEDAEAAVAPAIHFVQNWYEEFRDREQD